MTQIDAKEQVLSFLFNQEGVTLRNLKLFVGEPEKVTEDDLWTEMHSALIQERMGKADVSQTFEDNRPTTNVEEFLAAL